ncbi:hypothetical protein GCM10007147_23080 [Nocardiopsis kunsanensis]|uniref:Uncharacterized protein n=1 Tax=Nocardiopsis kunsanensis TaxID=141693 RepID=A0A918XC21_9ACTN|nr:stealth family protein [Nocardiopsis kunsanensis]GHD25714.1 hypothetical protein GCM10007147_23080 [Nocardiopsis kunsanensis]
MIPREAIPGTLVAPRRNRVSDLLTPDARTPATMRVREREHPTYEPFTWQTADDVGFPVDVVYTWVDGSDPDHAAKRVRHEEAAPSSLAANRSRFVDRQELRYSLRSLHMYAPFVRHVYLVTDAQVPGWLDRSAEGITVVDHRDVFDDPAALPTFNSHAIEGFDPASVEDLPAPVRRWTGHCIASGAPLSTTAALTMHGRFWLGGWRRVRARQLLSAARGYVWAGAVRTGPVPLHGFNLYHAGTGRLRWSAGGLVPVLSVEDQDVARSTAGRLAADLALTPAATLLPQVHWDDVDDDTAHAEVVVDGVVHRITIRVSPKGRLEWIALPRWSDPDGHGYDFHRFTVVFSGEQEVDGLLLPQRMRAGWGLDAREGAHEFYDLEIDTAVWL